MSLKLLAFATAVAVSGSCYAQKTDPADWASPRLSTEVSVGPAKVESQYVVRAKVVDLTTSKVLAMPVLVVAVNQPATVEIGSTSAVKLKMVFTVSADGKTVAYTNEIQRNGEIESSQRSTLAVAAGA